MTLLSQTRMASLDAHQRKLVLLPFAGVAILVAGAMWLPPASLPTFFRGELATVELLGCAGCAWAATAFEPGDYLRVAWALLGVCFLFIFFADLTRLPHLAPIMGNDLLRGILTVIANVSASIAAWRFGRAWIVAELPHTHRARRGAYVGTAAIALALAGGPLVRDSHALLSGNVAALELFASDLGDIVALCLLAPVLPTAVALRGGALAWPWSLQAASLLAWLGFDLSMAIVGGPAVDDVEKRLLLEIFRTLACLFVFAAGLAQRRIVRMAHPSLA